MAVMTHGGTVQTGSQPADFYALIDNGTVTGIVDADISSSANIDGSKILAASIDGSKMKGLANLPSGAGVIPSANLPTDTTHVLNDGTVNPTNLLTNGDFEAWSVGASSAPDGWTLGGSGAAIAREGTIIKIGTYSAKITYGAATAAIAQDIASTMGIAYFKGRSLTLSVWVYSATASIARIGISDNIGATYSSYHTGNSTWQLLTVTRTIDASATAVYANLYVGNTGNAYFDGAMFVDGASTFSFSPNPLNDGVWSDYSATSTIVGWTSFTTKEIYYKKVGKTVFVQFAIAGTSNSTSTSFTLPFNAASAPAGQYNTCFGADNGGGVSLSRMSFAASGNIATIGYNPVSAWTNSGTKTIYGGFWYQSA